MRVMTRRAEIDIDMVVENDPDSHPNDILFQDPHYRQQDEDRLEAWRNDEWRFVGVRAKATIKIPYGINSECWIRTRLFSPGLWGIESDSGGPYLQQVYREERDILVDMLDSLTKECRPVVRP